MAGSVRAVVFDVNETLSDMSALRARFEEVGAPGHLLPTWFAGVLRDGFAITAAGGYADFAEVAREGLRILLSGLPESERTQERAGDLANGRDREAAADRVLQAFTELGVHEDVPQGIRALREQGLLLATMTNGAAAHTQQLLARAGVLDCFDALLDVGGPRVWKPALAAYYYAVDRLGVAPGEALLVAVHPWDVDGARRAGLNAAWLRRGARSKDYPAVMRPPTHEADDLRDLARQLTAR